MIVPIVNEQDEIIGHKHRSEITQQDIYRVSALWITNTAGDILIAQRKFTKTNDPGCWGPAVAGTVEEDETYESNIYKEAEEELGIASIHFDIGPKLRGVKKHNYFVQWYKVVLDKNIEEFTPLETEVEQIRWISPSHLEQDIRNDPSHYLGNMDWYFNVLIQE